MGRIRREFPRAGDLTMLGAHSSHSYQTGTNLYFVYDYTIKSSPRDEIEVYHKPLNAIIVEEALRAGGSMVHHHGIGKYRTPWVRQEHGSAYYLLSTLKHAFDPRGRDERGHDLPAGAAGRRTRSREPAMRPYLLAIDNGSQSTKVAIFDARGRALASASRRLKPYDTSVPGRAVHPGDDLWDSIRHACRDAMARFSGEPADIAAVGLCTIRFCRALLAADGTLAEPVLSWMDERVARPYEATNPLTRYVTTSSGYITHRLTGQFVDTAANYEGVWPIDHDTAAWSSDPAAYAATGMPRDMLFDLVPPGGLLGAVTAAAALATGIPAGLPVYATANDKAVEALGSGLAEDGTVLLSLGTYIAAMTIGSSSRSADDSYWANFAARPGKYLYESTGIRRGMWMVSWYRAVLEGPQGQEPPARTAPMEDALNAAASELAPGSNGLLTLPDWLAPGDAAWRRGALLGFDGSQGRAHIYRLHPRGHRADDGEPHRGDGTRPAAPARTGPGVRRRIPVGPDDAHRGRRLRPSRPPHHGHRRGRPRRGHLRRRRPRPLPGLGPGDRGDGHRRRPVRPGRPGRPRLPADQPGLRGPDRLHRPAVPRDGRRPPRIGPRLTSDLLVLSGTVCSYFSGTEGGPSARHGHSATKR